MSEQLYQKMSDEEKINYFHDCLDFHKNELFPNDHIVDARIHRDEGHIDQDTREWIPGQWHLQILSVPVYVDKDKGTREICSTKAERDFMAREYQTQGRDIPSHLDTRQCFPMVQDRFYSYNVDKGHDIERRSPTAGRKHIPPKEWKAMQEMQRTIDRQREEIERQQKELEQLKRELENKNNRLKR